MIEIGTGGLRLAALAVALALSSGCQTAKLIGLYFQEKQYVEDRVLIAKLQGELAAHPELEGADIGVDAYLKNVALTGIATPAQAARAEAIAHAMDDVESVRNELRARHD